MEITPLEVEVVNEGSTCRLLARGELDLAGAPALDAAFLRVERTQVAEVVLDLRGVTFIDSAGIRCVLDAHHRTRSRGAELRIIPGLEAGVVFGLAGLSDRLRFAAEANRVPFAVMDEATPADPVSGLSERRREERRAVEEAGGGEAEGFELAEQDLIDHASHADDRSSTSILSEAGRDEQASDATYGEADEEHKQD